MKVWVTEHKSGGAGACIDFATVMNNMEESLSGGRTLDDVEGSEAEGWVSLGERYSAVLVHVEGS